MVNATLLSAVAMAVVICSVRAGRLTLRSAVLAGLALLVTLTLAHPLSGLSYPERGTLEEVIRLRHPRAVFEEHITVYRAAGSDEQTWYRELTPGDDVEFWRVYNALMQKQVRAVFPKSAAPGRSELGQVHLLWTLPESTPGGQSPPGWINLVIDLIDGETVAISCAGHARQAFKVLGGGIDIAKLLSVTRPGGL